MLLHDSSRSKTITSKIAHMLALDYQPFSIVNDRGFRELINFLEPRYSIPSRKHFSKTVVPKLYADTRGKVAESLQCELQTAQSFLWTLDMWTSRAQVPFISLTAHYLNAEFCLQNRTLDCSHFPGEHTGAAIYEKICHLTADWKISALLISVPVYVVSDNARNIKAALTGKPVEHLFCVAHTLQLAIDNAVTQVGMGKILKKCRSIVGHYKQSSKASERLHSLQSKLGLPEHSLCQMVETRWDSVYIMLERLQEQKESISADLPNTVKDSLTTQEWRLIEGYVTILKPLFLATKELCREDSPTISIVRPLLFSIEGYLKNYLSLHSGEYGSGVTLARELSKSLATRFQCIKEVQTYLLASVLDPRFKCVVSESHEQLLAKKLIVVEAKKKAKLMDPQGNYRVHKPSANISPQASTSAHDLWGCFEIKSVETKPRIDQVDVVENEVETFLQESVINRTDDALAWWKNNKTRFPRVAPVAQHYLGIPATSVASERLFSKAGQVVTVKRQNLSPKTIEKLVFLHDNL
ncbi:E3 SUMO-protein ligase ZBED1-like [Bacillus rossius redtenbacheri]|uniref:E3 SUMO-protein ligase ZBED1-like n=1 Tax=Bacillus rossius redtenbacheri TaxID=93214 RepID=UPI002FDCB66A